MEVCVSKEKTADEIVLLNISRTINAFNKYLLTTLHRPGMVCSGEVVSKIAAGFALTQHASSNTFWIIPSEK